MRLLATLLILPSIAGFTQATERRDAEVHVHGASSLMIAIEGQRLALEFEAPAMDLVGFEHAPTTAAQRQRLAEAIATLNAPERLFGIPEAANCTRLETTVHGPDASNHGANDHDHEHDKEHKHDKQHGHDKEHAHDSKEEHVHHEDDVHSEFHAVYLWTCEQMSALVAFNLTLFTQFPGMNKTTVMSATPRGQGMIEVNAEQPRITLP